MVKDISILCNILFFILYFKSRNPFNQFLINILNERDIKLLNLVTIDLVNDSTAYSVKLLFSSTLFNIQCTFININVKFKLFNFYFRV